MSTRRPLIALVAAALVVMTAAGCGTGVSNSSSGSAGTVKKGGILNVGTISSIDSLNPFIAISSQAYNAFVMEYPQLVQYGPGIKLEGDWATSWKVSNGGKTYTFHLKPGGKWSDGVPLTAEDAAWTGNTIIKYKSGASAVLAAALTHVKNMVAPNPTTLVVNYDQPIGNALAQLEQFWVLPKHVWDKQVGNNGKDLKTYRPEQHLPTVAAGPYTITSYAEKGTTVFKPNPYFYGPKSNAAAVALTDYTNSTSMIADLQSGTLDFVDQVPFDAAQSVKNSGTFNVDQGAGAEVTNITFNSNPAKPKNRELLDPKVKEALEYATDRQQIAKTVFQGFAFPWANLISKQSQGAGWVNPAVKPLPFDIAKANQILDGLGYMRGSNGIREVPATTGKYAQPAHEMSYDMMVTTALDFSGAARVRRHRQRLGQDRGQDQLPERRRQPAGVRHRDSRQLHEVRHGTLGLGRLRRPGLHAVGADPAAVVQLERHRLQQFPLRRGIHQAGHAHRLQAAPGAGLEDGAAGIRPAAVHPAGQRGAGDCQRQELDRLLPTAGRVLQVLLHESPPELT